MYLKLYHAERYKKAYTNRHLMTGKEKNMKIEKLPSGSYRIRKTYKGKTYTVITDYKPTQKEALELITSQLNKSIETAYGHITLYKAYLDYIDIKSNILSPSTKRGYKTAINAISDTLLNTNLSDIDSRAVQKFLNDYSVDHSPKTVKNVYGLISIIMKTYRPETVLSVQLPQAIKKEPYIPTDDEVKAIMKEIKGTIYYIPTTLAALGLRKSEIVALTVDDLTEDNKIIINKAKVRDENGNQVIKTTKTTDSTREIYIPQEIADLIREQGFIYKGFPDNITRNLKRVQDKLGIEHFPLHKMRHFFVSYAHNELKLSDAQIMEMGGWKSTHVMTNVYRHSMNQEEAKRNIAESMKSLF